MMIRPPNQAEQDLKQRIWQQAEADRGQLLLRQPFVGSLIMRMDLIPVCDYRLDTAATDGSNIFLNCHYYSQLDADERLFLLAHEVWHCVFLHFARRLGRDLMKWNIATDLEIQFTLAREGMKNPNPLPYHWAWMNLNAEEIYDQLEGTTVTGKEKFGDVHLEPGDISAESEQNPPAAGDHKNAKEKGEKQGRQEQEDDKSNTSQDDDDEKQPDDASNNPPACETADDGALVLDPDYAPFFVTDIVERTRTRVISTARQIERMRGTLPAGLNALLAEFLDPKLSWQELLAQFVTSCYAGKRRWLPPSRRHVAQGLYLPSLRGEKIKVVVAVDTSGSTSHDLPVFFTEINSLLASFGDYEMTLIQCDAAIQAVNHYSNLAPAPANGQWKVKGFGGTNFRPVFKFLENHPEMEYSLLIFFTDGYGTAPTTPPPYPVLWLLCKNGRAPANWGMVINL
ncbi:MAG: hypothetical protein GX945_14020 [Lentisphaerae bacterium]|nr:hypothetical protein [Lentisphaerota bacterium]